MSRPVHLVLHLFKEQLGLLRLGVVVRAGGVDIQHLAPEHLFRAADVADTRQQLFKIAVVLRLLEALIIHDKAFDNVFLEALGSPDPEAGGNRTFHPVTNGNDHVQIVEIPLAADLAATFQLN